MAYFEFPHTRTYDNDLGWLIRRVWKLSEDLENFIQFNTIKYADPIAWSIERQYESNTVVIDPRTGNAYISVRPVPSGVGIDNTDYWTPIFNYYAEFKKLEEQIAAANEELNPTASRNYEIGDLVWLAGSLYEIIADITEGSRFIENVNVSPITVEELIKSNKELITELSEEFNKVKNAFIFPEQFGAVGDGETDDTDALQAAIDYCAENNAMLSGYSGHKYLITRKLDIPYASPISFDGNMCEIIVGADIPTVFDIGVNPTGRDYDAGRQKPMIHHLKITNDGTHLAQFFATVAVGVKDYEVHNILSENTVNGIRLGDGTRNIPGDFHVHDCIFYGNGAEFDSCGFICYLSDNNFDNMRVYGFQRGFDFYTASNLFNVHVLIRWHGQSIDDFFPITPGGSEWNDYFPKTCFARLKTQASVPIEGCYCDGVHTFLFADVDYVRINITNLYLLGHSHANSGGCDIIDLTPIAADAKNITLDINGASIGFAGTNRQSYGIKTGSGYITRVSQISMSDIVINGYSKMANAADPILAGTARTFQKYSVFPANQWVVVAAVGNVTPNFRGMFYVTVNTNPFEVQMNVINGEINQLRYRGLNDQHDVHFTTWYSASYHALFICVKLDAGGNVPTCVRLFGYSEGGAYPLLLLPVYAPDADYAEPYLHTLLLSELTNETVPQLDPEYPLKNMYPVSVSANGVTVPANGSAEVSITFNAGRDVDSGIAMLNQYVNGLSISSFIDISQTGGKIRLANSTTAAITVTNLIIRAIVFKA